MRVNLENSTDADPLDLFCYLAISTPARLDEASARRGMLTRRQRSFSLSASNAPRPSDGRGTKGEGLRESGKRAGVRCRISSQTTFFSYFAPEAREILNDGKYAADGEFQLVAMHKHQPDVQKVSPISQHANVNEIIQLRYAVSHRMATASQCCSVPPTEMRASEVE